MTVTLNSYSVSAAGILTIDANIAAPGGLYIKRYTVKCGSDCLDECAVPWDYVYSPSYGGGAGGYTWAKTTKTSAKRVSKINLAVWPNGTLNLALSAEYVNSPTSNTVTSTDTPVNITVENTFNVPLRPVVDTPDKFYGFNFYGASANYGSGELSKPATLTFTVPSTAEPGETIPVTLYAEDDNAVTGYLITETATKPLATDPRWQPTAPTSYVVTGVGAVTLRAWAVDGDGNVSDGVTAAIQVGAVTSGVFATPTITLQPVVAAPALLGVQRGSFTTPAVTLRPTIAAPAVTGVQRGSFSMPSVALAPTVTAPTLNGVSATVSAGSFALPTVTLRPIVAAPQLSGMTGGASIRAPSGQLLNLRRIDGTPLTILSI